MIFETAYQPVIEDYTKDGKLSLYAILKILENTGSRHSDQAGDSVFTGRTDTRAWVLTDWKIEVTSYPSYGDTIKAQTWSQGLTSPLIASRDFLLYKNDEVCARGTTRWVSFDIAAGRPCRIEPELLAKYHPEEGKTVFESQRLERITEPAAFTSEKHIALRRSDIDFNNHVHNLLYLNFALETIPEPLYTKHDFKDLRITYKSALKSDTEIICKYAEVEGRHVVCIYGLDNQLKTLIQLG